MITFIISPYTAPKGTPGLVMRFATASALSERAPARRTYLSSAGLFTRRKRRTRSEASSVRQNPLSAASTILARCPVKP